jgi:hypothetical protein
MTKNRFKDFGKGTASTPEPLSFKLYDEEFECVPQIQGTTMLNLVLESSSDEPGAAAKVIVNFFKQVLKDESYTRFEALVNDKDKIVTVETLSEIVGWLITEYGDRPEEQPEA